MCTRGGVCLCTLGVVTSKMVNSQYYSVRHIHEFTYIYIITRVCTIWIGGLMDGWIDWLMTMINYLQVNDIYKRAFPYLILDTACYLVYNATQLMSKSCRTLGPQHTYEHWHWADSKRCMYLVESPHHHTSCIIAWLFGRSVDAWTPPAG